LRRFSRVFVPSRPRFFLFTKWLQIAEARRVAFPLSRGPKAGARKSRCFKKKGAPARSRYLGALRLKQKTSPAGYLADG
jgi:hypothetical protein